MKDFTLIVALDNFYLKPKHGQINLKVICIRREKRAQRNYVAEEN